MGSLWAKFKGMKLWLKIVIIIGILTVIGMIYNAVTGVPNNSNVNANENSVSNVSQSSVVVSSSQPLQEDSKPQEQSKLQEQSRLQEESRLQEQSKAQQSHDYTFIINTQSKVYHLHECSAAKRMSSDKKSYVTINAKTQSEAQQQIEARKTLEERARYTALESRAKDEELKKAGNREADLLKQMAEMRSQLEESQQAIEGIGQERDEAIAEAQSYKKSFFGFYRKSKKENL